MTDNRTNEPTVAQVEAATKAIYGERYGVDSGWEKWRHNYLPQARAALVAALEARQPSEDDREALIDVVKRNRSVVKRMSDGYPSVAFVTDETIADAILAVGFSRATVPDARDHLHAKCDCVPDLGPAHCHMCGNEQGSPVPWPECSAVRTAAPEWEYQCTNRFSTTGLLGDPELHARQCSGKIERRRTAGTGFPEVQRAVGS